MRISDWSSDVCPSDLLLRALLRRGGAGHLAQHRAAVAVDLCRRLAVFVAGVPAGRHRNPAAGDPGLHVLVVFGVPGQGRGGFGVSLRGAGIRDWGLGIRDSGIQRAVPYASLRAEIALITRKSGGWGKSGSVRVNSGGSRKIIKK